MVGTIALVSLGVIRIAFAPAFISCSMASTCPVLSPSYLPAKLRKSTPSSLAFAAAPSFIFAKNGLVFVFVISPTMIFSSAKAEADESAHTATAQAVIVFQRAPRWLPRVVVIRSSCGFAVMAPLAAGEGHARRGWVVVGRGA